MLCTSRKQKRRSAHASIAHHNFNDKSRLKGGEEAEDGSDGCANGGVALCGAASCWWSGGRGDWAAGGAVCLSGCRGDCMLLAFVKR